MSFFNLVSSATALASACNTAATSKTAQNSPIASSNLEGFTSAIRIAMFPYAPDIKLGLEEFAINFDFPNKVTLLDTKSFTRYWNGEGRKHFVVIKRIARIMLDLFPPIPLEHGKEPEPITKIYLHMISGLEYIKRTFFLAQEEETKKVKKIPTAATFDFDFNFKKHPEITDVMAAEAIQKTINLFQFCCSNKIEAKKDLTPIQIDVRCSYSKTLICQFANGLDLLKETQGNMPINKGWLSEHEFLSLDQLIQGQLSRYQQLVIKSGKLIPNSDDETLFRSSKDLTEAGSPTGDTKY